MTVDVITDIVVARSVDAVAAYATNSENAPAWYENITVAEWRTLVMRTADGPFEMETGLPRDPVDAPGS